MSENLSFLFSSKKCHLRNLALMSYFLLFSFLIFPQDTLQKEKMTHRIETNISITRFDIFHSFEYSAKVNHFQASVGLGYGVTRTFFQQRFFPKINVLGVYNLINNPKFSFGPSVYYSFSWLKINQTSKHFNNWNELFGGLHWEYGNKWRIGQTISAGYFSESYFNQFLNKRAKASNWGYFVNFSLIHEL